MRMAWETEHLKHLKHIKSPAPMTSQRHHSDTTATPSVSWAPPELGSRPMGPRF